jgi:hypothetical protein
MQVGNDRNMLLCASRIWKQEGFGAFYISFPTTLVMSIPFQAIQFTTYEYFRKMLNPQDVYNPLVHVVSGGIAGGCASFITNPLDVAKTMLQTRGLAQDVKIRSVASLRDACRIIYNTHGLMGFTRGVQARIAANVPSTAVAWTTYEFLKLLFTKNNV